jgi:hypothetical protein
MNTACVPNINFDKGMCHDSCSAAGCLLLHPSTKQQQDTWAPAAPSLDMMPENDTRPPLTQNSQHKVQVMHLPQYELTY